MWTHYFLYSFQLQDKTGLEECDFNCLASFYDKLIDDPEMTSCYKMHGHSEYMYALACKNVLSDLEPERSQRREVIKHKNNQWVAISIFIPHFFLFICSCYRVINEAYCIPSRMMMKWLKWMNCSENALMKLREVEDCSPLLIWWKYSGIPYIDLITWQTYFKTQASMSRQFCILLL